MNYDAPASLTARLLVSKGSAKPAGFSAARDYSRLSLVGPTPAANRPNATVQTRTAPTKAPGVAKPARVKMSLRLDPGRHLRLKLTAAHMRVSVQELLTNALDQYLNQVGPQVLGGDCRCANAPDVNSDRPK